MLHCETQNIIEYILIAIPIKYYRQKNYFHSFMFVTFAEDCQHQFFRKSGDGKHFVEYCLT